ncbi:MAG: PQQ-binding-like beta-propeller repeat protein [Anaerolineae bacterium]|nr:PQQ-binding-like beta-propeller repeat protein [Anaerolineae bacterium]
MSTFVTESAPTLALRRVWWQRRRLWVGVAAIVLLALVLSSFASVEETRLVALNPTSGRVAWSVQPSLMRREGIGFPVSADGRLYFSIVIPPSATSLLPDYAWQFQAADAATGRILWSYTPDPAQLGKVAARLTAAMLPVASGDLIYVPILDATYDMHIVALDAATGTLKGQISGLYFDDSTLTGLNSLLFHTPRSVGFAVNADRVIVVLRDDVNSPVTEADGPSRRPIRVAALDRNLGKVVWNSALAITDGYGNGAFRWVQIVDQAIYILVDRILVLNAQNGELQSEEAVTATLYWTTTTLFKRYDVSDTESKIDAIDRTTGALIWSYTIPAATSCTAFSASEVNVYTFCLNVQDDKSKTNGESDTDSTTDKVGDDSSSKSAAAWVNFLLVLDARTGAEKWREPIADNLYSVITQEPAVLSGGGVAVVGGELREMRISVFGEDGTLRWSVRVDETFTQVAADTEYVYVIDTAARWQFWLAMLNGEWR